MKIESTTGLRLLILTFLFWSSPKLLAEKTPSGPLRVFMGIISRYEPSDSGGGRQLVEEVIPESPAARAGLRVGDFILGIDGRPHRAASLSELLENLGWIEPGRPVVFEVLRDGKKSEVEIVPEPLSPDRQEALRKILAACRTSGGCNELGPAPAEISLHSFAVEHGSVVLTFIKDPSSRELMLSKSDPALPASWDFRRDPVFRDRALLLAIDKLLAGYSEIEAVYWEREPGNFVLTVKF